MLSFPPCNRGLERLPSKITHEITRATTGGVPSFVSKGRPPPPPQKKKQAFKQPQSGYSSKDTHVELPLDASSVEQPRAVATGVSAYMQVAVKGAHQDLQDEVLCLRLVAPKRVW